MCDEGLGTLPGSGKARVARVAHAETARVRPGAEPLPCVSPRRRVADSQAVSRLCPTPRRGGASRTRKLRAAAVGLGRPAEAKGEPRSSRPRPFLRHDVDFDGDADDVDVDGCPLVPPPHLPLFIILREIERELCLRGEEGRQKERKIWESGDEEREGGRGDMSYYL